MKKSLVGKTLKAFIGSAIAIGLGAGGVKAEIERIDYTGKGGTGKGGIYKCDVMPFQGKPEFIDAIYCKRTSASRNNPDDNGAIYLAQTPDRAWHFYPKPQKDRDPSRPWKEFSLGTQETFVVDGERRVNLAKYYNGIREDVAEVSLASEEEYTQTQSDLDDIFERLGNLEQGLRKQSKTRTVEVPIYQHSLSQDPKTGLVHKPGIGWVPVEKGRSSYEQPPDQSVVAQSKPKTKVEPAVLTTLPQPTKNGLTPEVEKVREALQASFIGENKQPDVSGRERASGAPDWSIFAGFHQSGELKGYDMGLVHYWGDHGLAGVLSLSDVHSETIESRTTNPAPNGVYGTINRERDGGNAFGFRGEYHKRNLFGWLKFIAGLGFTNVTLEGTNSVKQFNADGSSVSQNSGPNDESVILRQGIIGTGFDFSNDSGLLPDSLDLRYGQYFGATEDGDEFGPFVGATLNWNLN